MKLTVQIKLQPTPEQVDALRETLETANAAADRLSQLAWEAKEFRRFPLHKRFYRQIRNEFPLTAQVVCLLNAKVADAYKLDKKVQRVFRKHGSISYDARILSLNLIPSTVSIWTVKGRAKMPFIHFLWVENPVALARLFQLLKLAFDKHYKTYKILASESSHDIPMLPDRPPKAATGA